MSLIALPAVELVELLRKREVSASELAGQFIQAIRDREKHVRAFSNVNEAAVLQQANDIDARRTRGVDIGILSGLPIALKDLICTANERTTCGSKILHNFVPPYDAHVVSQ